MHGTQPQPRRRRSVWRTTRRVVLVGGGATVGLAIGWLGWPREEARNLGVGPGETLMNAWLKIGRDGVVTVIVPQAEMGQGVHSTLAQVLADELGADWRTVRVEPAPLNPVYANRAMIDDGVEGLPQVFHRVARWTGHRLVERLDLQLTGGSTSIRAYEAPMRFAGATARALLCKAAARGWDVEWTACDTANGFVVHGANRVAFAELAGRAALETPPREPALRVTRSVGRSPPRLDVPAKVDGGARFGADVRLPDMVYAAIRHGPVGSALPPASVGAPPPGTLSVTAGPGWAAATAETWFGAKRALDGMALRWPAPADAADSEAIGARLAAALADAPPLEGEGRLIEARYGVPFLAHAALEPMTATARVGGGRAELWAPTQSTRLATYVVARALGLPEAAVTVHPTFVGGGFGRKAEADALVQAALIARDAGRPAQLIWSREEDMSASPRRPAARALMRARLGDDGGIASWNALIAAPSASQSFAARNLPGLPLPSGADASAVTGADGRAYAMGARSAEHLPVGVPVPTGFWRSVEHSYTAFFVESFVDELAAAMGRDPVAYRLALLAERPRHAATLRAAADAAGYAAGMGVALHESFGSIVAQVVELAPAAKGDAGPRVARVTCAIDCGRAINPDIIRAQIEGSIVWALSAALHGRASFEEGAAVERNFDGYRLLTLAETPAIEVVILTGEGRRAGGVGEPGVPPLAPALANALAARGRRPRDLPIA